MGLRLRRYVTVTATLLALVGGPTAPVANGISSAAGTTGVTATTAASSYALLARFDGRAARWNPCQAVPWTFNPANAPASGFAVVKAALARVTQLTGLRFAYVGTTRTVPSSAYVRQSWGAYRPLLIGWSTARTSDLLAGTGVTHVGETRMNWVGLRTPSGSQAQIASGVVVFNARSAAPTWGAGSRYTYALHELGHAVGLGHARSSTQLMSTILPRSLRDYGSGDRAGLAAVGARGGCLASIR